MKNNCSYPKAMAVISGGDVSSINGKVQFFQKEKGTLVVAYICGLPQIKDGSGFFAFHIHEGNSCAGENFADTKGHFNPENEPHPMHKGDLPPLISCNGSAYLAVLTDRFNICDIIGKTVVIHDSFDDFHSQPSGNAGKKIACGVIKKYF